MKRVNLSNYGPSGIAQVDVSTKRQRVRVVMTVDEVEQTYMVDLDDAPTWIKPGKWFVTLSGDHKKIYGARPVDGMFQVKVKEFRHKEKELPSPRLEKFKDSEYETFSVTLVLTKQGSQYDGSEVPLKLRYWFTPDESGNVALEFHPKATKNFPILADFLEATGFQASTEQKPMKWPDSGNILPNMEKRIKTLDKTFGITMKDGWVNAIYIGDDAEKDPDEDKPAKPPKKVDPTEAPWGEDDELPDEWHEGTKPDTEEDFD